MRAERYRLRFFTGATLTAMTYGGGKYGDATYGMQQSDSLTTAHHRLVPLPAGAPTVPSWRYRQNDTQPDWEAQVIADDGVVNLTGVANVVLVLTPVDPSQFGNRIVDLTIAALPSGDQVLRHQWSYGELGEPGVFRVGVVIQFTTGRRLSVPSNDTHVLVITPNGDPPVPMPARWDAGRWDAADWS